MLLCGGRVLVLWEKWTERAHVDTYGMVVDEFGVAATPPFPLGKAVRVSCASHPFVRDGRVVWAVSGMEGTTVCAITLASGM